jgi:autotransporter-associated beta strand protein
MPLSHRQAAYLVVAFALLIASPTAFAQTDLFWNPLGGGTGNWDTTTTNWSTAITTAGNMAWPNTGNERANFGNTTTTAAAVTVAAPVSAFGINFLNYESQFVFVSGNATGPGAYTISGTATNKITLTGAGGVIDVANVISNATTGATISAPIAGSVGLTKNDVGVLILSGTNTYTGATQINGGALTINAAGALGSTSGVTVAGGGALQLAVTPTTAVPLTLNGGGSTTSASGNGTGGALRSTATASWTGLITLAAASRINSDSGTLTLGTAGTTAITSSAPGSALTIGGAATVTIPGNIDANVGQLTKDGAGTLNLNGANLYTGGTVILGSKLTGTAQAAAGASPFSSGAITLNSSTLTLNGVAATVTTTTVGDLNVSAATSTGSAAAYGTGASNLIVSNAAGGTTNFAFNNLVRGGTGSVLVVTPGTGANGALGSGANVTFANGAALQTATGAGILPSWVANTNSTTPTTTDFSSYGASGVTVATYTSTDITTSTNTSVVNQTVSATLAAPAAAYALKTNSTVNLAGNTLTLGSGSGTAGLILATGGGVSGGTISFGNAEATVYTSGTTTLGAAGDNIVSNGLTITAVGATTITIGGNIADGSQPTKLVITAPTSTTNITLSGNNTYTGGTVLAVNTGASGNILIGSNNAFGTGKVTNIIVPGTASPQLQPTGGDRVLSNAFDLDGGLTFTGTTNSLTLAGPINVIQNQAGPVYTPNGSAPGAPTATRTLNNTMTGNSAVIYGTSVAAASTITLGNPVANGGDGIGKNLAFASATGTQTVINDAIVDPAAGGGAASGVVTVSSGATNQGLIQFNNPNSTYSGGTRFSGGFIKVQFPVSTTVNGSGVVTAGPFGTGPLVYDNGSNVYFEPIGNQTIANPVQMATGFTTGTESAGNTLTLSGPIMMSINNGRFMSNGTFGTNNPPAAQGLNLVLGAAASPSTITLPNGGATVTISAVTGPITVNDVIQDPPGLIGAPNRSTVRINGNANETLPVTFTAANTYAGPTSITHGQLIVNNASGSGTGTGAVTVGAATSGTTFPGVLSGTGSLAGAVTVSVGTGGGANAMIAPGPGALTNGSNSAPVVPFSIGTLTLGGGLTINGTYLADVQTGPNANDLLAVTGGVTLGAASILSLSPSSTFDGTSTYTLVTYTGSLTGTFSSVANLPAPYQVVYSNPGVVQIVPVPEPVFVLGACGLVGGLGWWRARRKRPAGA